MTVLRSTLDTTAPGYAEAADALLAPFSAARVDRVVAEEGLPRLLGGA